MRTLRVLTIPFTLTLLLAACGPNAALPTTPASSTAPQPSAVPASPSPAPAASPSPSASASPSGALRPAFTLTNADDGKTFHAKVGQVIDLALQANPDMQNWAVQEPDPAILAPTVNPAATAVRGATLRAFRAVGPGTATIAATDRPVCNPGQACAQFIVAWKAMVVVDPS